MEGQIMNSIPGITANELAVLRVLAAGPEPLDLNEIHRRAESDPATTIDAVYGLVFKEIIISDNYALKYTFAATTEAALVYDQLEKLESEGA